MMTKILKVLLALVLVGGSGLLAISCNSELMPTPTEEPPAYQLEVNLPGVSYKFPVDSIGSLMAKVDVSSADGAVKLVLDKGTVVRDKDGKPLQVIRVAQNTVQPLPSGGVQQVGPAYTLEPSGAAFNPFLWLTLGYDPGKLGEGVEESGLYIASQNGGQWHPQSYRRVDIQSRSVTTQITGSATLTILGTLPPAPPPVEGREVGNLAPDFEFRSIEGTYISLRDFSQKESRPILINFWQTGCPGCLDELTSIQQIEDEWSSKGLAVLTINVGDAVEKVQELVDNNKLYFSVLLDAAGDLAAKYNVSSYPTTFFIDKRGVIQVIKNGAFRDKAEMETSLRKIIS